VAGAGGCLAGSEVAGCSLVGCCVPVLVWSSVVVCVGGSSGVDGCSGAAACSGCGLGLGVLGRICIFSAIGCNRSGGG
jgi:hypothetical protein